MKINGLEKMSSDNSIRKRKKFSENNDNNSQSEPEISPKIPNKKKFTDPDEVYLNEFNNLLNNDELEPKINSYHLTRIVLVRYLAFIYCKLTKIK